jgi:hypothetical protein
MVVGLAVPLVGLSAAAMYLTYREQPTPSASREISQKPNDGATKRSIAAASANPASPLPSEHETERSIPFIQETTPPQTTTDTQETASAPSKIIPLSPPPPQAEPLPPPPSTIENDIYALLVKVQRLGNPPWPGPHEILRALVPLLEEYYKEGHRLTDEMLRGIMGGNDASPDFTLGVLDILEKIRTPSAILDRGSLLLALHAAHPDEQTKQMLRDYTHEELVGVIVTGTENPEASSRAVALLNQALRIFPDDEEMVSYALFTLRNQSADVRGTAVITLGNVGSLHLLPEIRRIIQEETNRQVISFAYWALGNYKPEDVTDLAPLLMGKMQQGDPNAPVTLARWGYKEAGPRLVETIAPYAHDDYEGTIGTAALVKLNDRSLIPDLRKLLEHPDPNTRYNAAFVLAFYGQSDVLSILRESQTSPDLLPGGRLDQWTTYALAKLGDESIRSKLEEWAASGDPNRKAIAEKALKLLNKE